MVSPATVAFTATFFEEKLKKKRGREGCSPLEQDWLGKPRRFQGSHMVGEAPGSLTHGKEVKSPSNRFRALLSDRTDDLPLTRRPLWAI